MKNVVQLTLDSYQDLFSDFDPRPYAERGLSDDFLNELKSAVGEIPFEEFEMIFSLPAKERDTELEKVIIERLHSYFRKREMLIAKEKRDYIKSGVFLTLVGLAVLCGSIFLAWYETDDKIFSIFKVILEPAGWFMSWYGLDQVFYLSRKNIHNLKFYRKAMKGKILFINA